MNISEAQEDPTLMDTSLSPAKKGEAGALSIGEEEKTLSLISDADRSLQAEANTIEKTSEQVLAQQQPLFPDTIDLEEREASYLQRCARLEIDQTQVGIEKSNTPEEIVGFTGGLFTDSFFDIPFEERSAPQRKILDEFDAQLAQDFSEFPVAFQENISQLRAAIKSVRSIPVNSEVQLRDFDALFQELKTKIKKVASIISFMNTLGISPADWDFAQASYTLYQRNHPERTASPLQAGELKSGSLAILWIKQTNEFEETLLQLSRNFSPEAQSEVERIKKELDVLRSKMFTFNNINDLIAIYKEFQTIQEKVSMLRHLEDQSIPLDSSALMDLSQPWRQDLDAYDAELAALYNLSASDAQSEITRVREQINIIRTEPLLDKASLTKLFASVSQVKTELDTFKAINEFAFQLEIEPEKWSIAKEIYTHYKNNWANCYKIVISDKGEELCQQTHGIEHLKIYKDPVTGILVADYGIEKAGAGIYKRIKKAVRIGPKTAFQARLTSPAKDLVQGQPISAEMQAQITYINEVFIDDVAVEVDARALLKTILGYDIPSITQIVKIQYINADGVVKTRYVTQFYPTCLHNEIYWGDREKNLQLCRDPVDALVCIHKCGYAHNDIKAGNILVDGPKGFLNDFGLFKRQGDPLSFNRGSSVYMAPETVLYEQKLQLICSSSSDMFSVGVLLLHAMDSSKYKIWCQDIDRLEKSVEQVQQERDRLTKQNLDLTKKIKEAKTAYEASVKSGADSKIVLETKREYTLLVNQKVTLLQLEVNAAKELVQAKKKFNEEYLKVLGQLQSDLEKAEASDSIYGLIKELLSETPGKRPGAEEALRRIDARIQQQSAP